MNDVASGFLRWASYCPERAGIKAGQCVDEHSGLRSNPAVPLGCCGSFAACGCGLLCAGFAPDDPPQLRGGSLVTFREFRAQRQRRELVSRLGNGST